MSELWLQHVFEAVLRRLPVSRHAYRELDIARSRLAASDKSAALVWIPGLQSAQTRQHSEYPWRNIEFKRPVMADTGNRIAMTLSCADAAHLPKVADAGKVIRDDNGIEIQIMHNGLKMLAGGYYGAWVRELIERSQGHHEPQEEIMFAEILKYLPDDAAMLELGGHWSFYSLWFLAGRPGRKSFIVEADPQHLSIGRRNAELNHCDPIFIHGVAGAVSAPPAEFLTESSGLIDLPGVCVADIMSDHDIGFLDLLHCDAQGIELAVLESCLNLMQTKRLGWLVISTHVHHISHDPLTHQRCLELLRHAGAGIIAEHDVSESFSGDGLIVAKCGKLPDGWVTPRISYNRAAESLFRNPLYDLAAVAGPSKPK